MATIRTGRGEQVTGEDLIGAVRFLFTQPQFDPPILSRLALDLYESSIGPEADPSEALELIGLDPQLADGVLRAARARTLAGAPSVSSLGELVAWSGVRGLANLTLEVAATAVFSGAPGYEAQMAACHEHSIRAAHSANIIAGDAARTEPAFMAGLLHDCGTAVGLIALADRRLVRTRHPFEEIESVLIDAHEEIGGIVAAMWHLPGEVCHAVATHHDATPSTLGAMIQVVDRVCSGKMRIAPVSVQEDDPRDAQTGVSASGRRR